MGNLPTNCGTACTRGNPEERQCLSKVDRIADFERNLPFGKISIDEFERLACSAAKVRRQEDGLYSPPLNQSTITLRQVASLFN